MGYRESFEKAVTVPFSAGEALIRGIAIPAVQKVVELVPFSGDTHSAEVIELRDSRGTPLQGWAAEIEASQPDEPNIDLGDQLLPPKKRFTSAKPVDRIYD